MTQESWSVSIEPNPGVTAPKAGWTPTGKEDQSITGDLVQKCFSKKKKKRIILAIQGRALQQLCFQSYKADSWNHSGRYPPVTWERPEEYKCQQSMRGRRSHAYSLHNQGSMTTPFCSQDLWSTTLVQSSIKPPCREDCQINRKQIWT